MEIYTIDRGTDARRQAVRDWLFGLDMVSPATADMIVTAWVSTWSSSPHERLEDMPYSLGVDYPLMRHVNEVTRGGIALAERAREDWGAVLEDDVLMSILILHDVDKPLMYVRENDTVAYSALSRQIPHGVVGGMLLKELGFPADVVSVVTTHAANAPFHGQGMDALVLHYADLFSADHAFQLSGRTPFYQRHYMP